ncbi:MAG: PilN domain-containing protein [Phycisphaerae bacterium]|nr:PilN domain-containing protein [Phycisphaerae bacterium]
MPNINFVPDDYIQNTESRHTNVFCIVLLLIVMSGLMSSFGIIKMRQRSCAAQESLVNSRLARMEESIQQFEQLQAKRKEMMKTALTTAQLLEPLPRSIVLASLTNELPSGTSLAEVKFNQKDVSGGKSSPAASSAAKKSGGKAKAGGPEGSLEKNLETQIEIVGVAPSDLQVAAYIEQLGGSPLFNGVALVESKEYKTREDLILREFTLRTTLCPDVRLTEEDVRMIRERAEKSVYNF